MASYYLGCLLYSFERYIEAAKAWEKTVKSLDFAPAYRNLSLAYYDHLDKPALARKSLETARRLMPESGRIFFELTQLYKSLDLPIDERLALYESDPDLVATRDDCTLQYSVLLTEKGEYEKAKAVLDGHRFHTYEGGEGNLTQHHAWLYLLRGLVEKDAKKRTEILESGLVFPLKRKTTSSTTRPCITRSQPPTGRFRRSSSAMRFPPKARPRSTVTGKRSRTAPAAKRAERSVLPTR